MSRAFIVLGSPRSGTSLIAGILDRLSVYMGERFRPAGEFNPKGAYENLDFVELNNEIMACIKGNEYGVPNRDRLAAAPDIFRVEAREVIERNRRDLWGWKDPRTSFTVPVFKPLLENPTYIIALRDSLAVIESLKRVGNPAARAARTVDVYLTHAINNVKGENWTAFFYEEFIDDGAKAVERFVEAVGIDADITRAVEFIDPELRHF